MQRVLVAGSVLLASLMIASAPRSAAADDVLATVGTKTFTRADIEARVKPKLIEVEAQKYEIMREGLDEAVAEELFKLEADGPQDLARAAREGRGRRQGAGRRPTPRSRRSTRTTRKTSRARRSSR